jgi:hypothetical protein
MNGRSNSWSRFGLLLTVCSLIGLEGGLAHRAVAAEPVRIGFEFNPDPHLAAQHERIVVTYPAACLDIKAQLLAKEGDLPCDNPLDCLGLFDGSDVPPLVRRPSIADPTIGQSEQVGATPFCVAGASVLGNLDEPECTHLT